MKYIIICKKNTYIKVSLKRNTHKTRLCMDQLMKMRPTRGSQELDLVFPLGAMPR